MVGQRRSIMTGAAPRRPEVGVLERRVGSEENVKPKQGVRFIRAMMASTSSGNPLGAESGTSDSGLVNTSPANVIPVAVLCRKGGQRGACGCVREIIVALEVTHLREATSAILAETVIP